MWGDLQTVHTGHGRRVEKVKGSCLAWLTIFLHMLHIVYGHTHKHTCERGGGGEETIAEEQLNNKTIVTVNTSRSRLQQYMYIVQLLDFCHRAKKWCRVQFAVLCKLLWSNVGQFGVKVKMIVINIHITSIWYIDISSMCLRIILQVCDKGIYNNSQHKLFTCNSDLLAATHTHTQKKTHIYTHTD